MELIPFKDSVEYSSIAEMESLNLPPELKAVIKEISRKTAKYPVHKYLFLRQNFKTIDGITPKGKKITYQLITLE
jgi:hypothetical protein